MGKLSIKNHSTDLGVFVPTVFDGKVPLRVATPLENQLWSLLKNTQKILHNSIELKGLDLSTISIVNVIMVDDRPLSVWLDDIEAKEEAKRLQEFSERSITTIQLLMF